MIFTFRFRIYCAYVSLSCFGNFRRGFFVVLFLVAVLVVRFVVAIFVLVVVVLVVVALVLVVVVSVVIVLVTLLVVILKELVVFAVIIHRLLLIIDIWSSRCFLPHVKVMVWLSQIDMNCDVLMFY